MERVNATLLKQMSGVQAQYPYLKRNYYPSKGTYQLEGRVEINAVYNDVFLYDQYIVRIEIDNSYPQTFPKVWEIGGKISPNYAHKYSDDQLCLAAPLELILFFSRSGQLVNYINHFLVSYLYSYSYLEKFGYLPFGERPHGAAGNISFLLDFLRVDDSDRIVPFLAAITAESFYYNENELCPCGSGLTMGECSHTAILSDTSLSAFLQYCYKTAKQTLQI